MGKASSLFFIILLFSALITTLPSASADRASIIGKYHVKIINELGSHKNLDVHCKSGDDDKGYHIIPPPPGGNSYEFGFHVNILGSTLYFCNLWQGPRWQHHAVFDVFDASEGFLYPTCGGRYCTWIARDDGIYSYNERTKQETYRHPWETVRRDAIRSGDESGGPVMPPGPSSVE